MDKLTIRDFDPAGKREATVYTSHRAGLPEQLQRVENRRTDRRSADRHPQRLRAACHGAGPQAAAAFLRLPAGAAHAADRGRQVDGEVRIGHRVGEGAQAGGGRVAVAGATGHPDRVGEGKARGIARGRRERGVAAPLDTDVLVVLAARLDDTRLDEHLRRAIRTYDPQGVMTIGGVLA